MTITQQEFLKKAKAKLGLTWDAMADQSGISRRALKTYRMPETSMDYRPLPPLARRAIEALLSSKNLRVE